MADSSGALQRPPSLREFLDSGPDLAAEDVWAERLAEVVYLDLPVTPPKERAKRAAEARARALDLACARGGRGVRGRRRQQQQRERSRNWHWIADLYEAPELAKLLLEALPPDIIAIFTGVEELVRRPYPLSVGTPGTWWSCNSCGAAFDDGEAVAITISGRPGFSDVDPIHYCAECISLAAEVAGHAERGRL